jgi:hypothetical protein
MIDLENESVEDARNKCSVGRRAFRLKRRFIERALWDQDILNLGGLMKTRIMTVAGLAFARASAVGAQTKITGTVTCAKPDPNYTIDAGDHPGHSFGLSKLACKWTDTLINGLKITDDTGAGTSEATATKITSNGTRVVTMENGDKFFANVHDSSPVKDGMPTDIEGTFTISGGTGKLKGIKGHGTYKVTVAADGTSSVAVTGEYTISAPAAPKSPTGMAAKPH